jgi:hypothetical protein
MEPKAKYIAILPVRREPNGCLSAFVVPRLLGIADAAKYLSATTWKHYCGRRSFLRSCAASDGR